MTEFLPRSEWTSAPAGGGPLTVPNGYALHWPGSSTLWAGRSQDYIAKALEGIRRFHVNGRGWADIAYQVAIDQDGRVWDLRGIQRTSAANGDGPLNRAWGAVLLLLGPGEAVTPAMADAVRAWRAQRWLARFPAATRETTHGAIRPGGTVCPGPAASGAVYAKTFTRNITKPKPAPTEDDDMPTPEDYAKAVVDEWQSRVPIQGGENLARMVVDTYRTSQRTAAALREVASTLPDVTAEKVRAILDERAEDES